MGRSKKSLDRSQNLVRTCPHDLNRSQNMVRTSPRVLISSGGPEMYHIYTIRQQSSMIANPLNFEREGMVLPHKKSRT